MLTGKNKDKDILKLIEDKIISSSFSPLIYEKFLWDIERWNYSKHFFTPFIVENLNNGITTWHFLNNSDKKILKLFQVDYNFKKNYLNKYIWNEEFALKSAISKELYEKFKFLIQGNNNIHLNHNGKSEIIEFNIFDFVLDNSFVLSKIKNSIKQKIIKKFPTISLSPLVTQIDILALNILGAFNSLFVFPLNKFWMKHPRQNNIKFLELFKYNNDRKTQNLIESIKNITFGSTIYLFLNLKQDIQLKVIKNYFPLFSHLWTLNLSYTDDELISFFVSIYHNIVGLRNSIEHINSIFDYHWNEYYFPNISKYKVFDYNNQPVDFIPSNSKLLAFLKDGSRITDFKTLFLKLLNLKTWNQLYINYQVYISNTYVGLDDMCFNLIELCSILMLNNNYRTKQSLKQNSFYSLLKDNILQIEKSFYMHYSFKEKKWEEARKNIMYELLNRNDIKRIN